MLSDITEDERDCKTETHLPPRCREDVLIALVPTTLDDLAGVRLVLFLGGVGEQPYVVVHVEVEQRARLAAGLVHDEVVECVVLGKVRTRSKDVVRLSLHEV